MFIQRFFIFQILVLSIPLLGVLPPHASSRAASPISQLSQSQSSQTSHSTSASDTTPSREVSSDYSPAPSPRAPHPHTIANTENREADEKSSASTLDDRIAKFLIKYYCGSEPISKIYDAVKVAFKDATECDHVSSFILRKVKDYDFTHQGLTPEKRSEKIKWALYKAWVDNPSERRAIQGQTQSK